jgi:hypothetical protein
MKVEQVCRSLPRKAWKPAFTTATSTPDLRRAGRQQLAPEGLRARGGYQALRKLLGKDGGGG